VDDSSSKLRPKYSSTTALVKQNKRIPLIHMAAIVDSTLPPPLRSFALDSNQELLEKHNTWGREEPAIQVLPEQTLEIHDGSKVVMGLGAGDSYLIPNFLSSASSPSADEAFRLLKPPLDPNETSEVNYHQMYVVGMSSTSSFM